MTIQLVIFIIALLAVIFFFKNFNASVYFVVMVDIFFRIITYLKANILRADAFEFLQFIPENIPAIIYSFDIGIFADIFMGIYVVMFIVFEVLLIRIFIKRKF